MKDHGYEVHFFVDGVFVNFEANHVDLISAEMVGEEWVKINPDSHSYTIFLSL